MYIYTFIIAGIIVSKVNQTHEHEMEDIGMAGVSVHLPSEVFTNQTADVVSILYSDVTDLFSANIPM